MSTALSIRLQMAREKMGVFDYWFFPICKHFKLSKKGNPMCYNCEKRPKHTVCGGLHAQCQLDPPIYVKMWRYKGYTTKDQIQRDTQTSKRRLSQTNKRDTVEKHPEHPKQHHLDLECECGHPRWGHAYITGNNRCTATHCACEGFSAKKLEEIEEEPDCEHFMEVLENLNICQPNVPHSCRRAKIEGLCIPGHKTSVRDHVLDKLTKEEKEALAKALEMLDMLDIDEDEDIDDFYDGRLGII